MDSATLMRAHALGWFGPIGCARAADAEANSPVARTPLPEALAKLPKEKIVEALTTGVTQAQGADLAMAQRVAIADFLPAGNVAHVDATCE